jgi:hypothetical protein
MAALGWVLAVYFFVSLCRAGRMLRESRAMLEELLRAHRPDVFALYAAKLAARGGRPLTSQPTTKEP